MTKRLYIALLLLIYPVFAIMATHNRAGEITYKQISDFTYEITITTFTNTLSAADRSELEVQWGDNSTSVAPRVSIIYLPRYYKRNTYIIEHTYPGPGIYEIVVQDPNRNFGVKNIPNSVNVVFSIKTTMVINPMIGYNNTPVLLNPPIDKAALGHMFIHNPAAYDPDGDSLSYKLAVCLKENGEPIENFTLPPSSDTLYIDEITGDLIWNTPIDTGKYNIAIDVEEWRKGIKIGNIVRDMQIEVYNPDNNPPQNPVLNSLCVEAGTLVEFEITSTDPDLDQVSHSSVGGVYIVDSPAVFTTLAFDSGFVTSRFSWNTYCHHVRNQPYDVIFKVEDNNPELTLVDIDNISIKVIAPSPKNLFAIPFNNSIKIGWDPSECNEAAGYSIYRRENSYSFTPDSCENGIPGYTGYVKVGETYNLNDTSFLDNNNEAGLLQGIEYCYRVLTIFDDGTSSFTSEEICASLVQGQPVITNVSIRKSDETNGSIYLAWEKPTDFDTVLAPGPYKYLISRSDDLWGNSLILIDSLSGIDNTVFIDTLFNTANSAYSYSVEFYNDEPGKRFRISIPQIASSLFINTNASDNKSIIDFNKNVPWFNSQYIIYRWNNNILDFESIAVTDNTSYTDSGLVNEVQYCYQVLSIGAPYTPGIISPYINFSNEACATPKDTIPSCPPELSVISECDSLYNFLIWNNPNNICTDDVTGYNIYYKNTYDGSFELIASIDNSEDTTFSHYPENSMAACYGVTAIDSFMNESEFYTALGVCVDECTNYELPNVFTPNGDDINDIYMPKSYSFVEKVDMKIYNRWGDMVYQTDDRNINWNGKILNTNKLVAPGVYYYICDVYEIRLHGIEPRNIVGFIHVYTDKNAKIDEDK